MYGFKRSLFCANKVWIDRHLFNYLSLVRAVDSDVGYNFLFISDLRRRLPCLSHRPVREKKYWESNVIHLVRMNPYPSYDRRAMGESLKCIHVHSLLVHLIRFGHFLDPHHCHFWHSRSRRKQMKELPVCLETLKPAPDLD